MNNKRWQEDGIVPDDTMNNKQQAPLAAVHESLSGISNQGSIINATIQKEAHKRVGVIRKGTQNMRQPTHTTSILRSSLWLVGLCIFYHAGTSDALAPSDQSATLTTRGDRFRLHSFDDSRYQEGCSAASRSPLFLLETTLDGGAHTHLSSSLKPTVPKNFLQRLRRKQSAWAVAASLALLSASSLAIEPAHAAEGPARTLTPLEKAVEKYSVSFWTPETDTLPSQQTQQQQWQQRYSPATQRRIVARRQEAARKLMINRKIAMRAVETAQQRQRALRPSRGGHDQYPNYSDSRTTGEASHYHRLSIVTFALLTMMKLTVLTSLVVITMAAGNERFADSLREQVIVRLDDFSDYRVRRKLQGDAKHRLDRAKVAKVAKSAADIAKVSRTAAGRVRRIVATKWDLLRTTYQKVVTNLLKELDSDFGAKTNEYTSAKENQQETAVLGSTKLTTAPPNSISSPPSTQRIDSRLEKYYQRVRNEERGKVMTNVMLRKSSDEDYFETISQIEAHRQQHKEKLMNYGLQRTHNTDTAGEQYNKRSSSNEDRIQKILKDPMAPSSPVKVDAEAHLRRPLGKPAQRPRAGFDIRYRMWKFLSRQRETTAISKESPGHNRHK